MLRTNLSTRPFYNERLVHSLLAVAGALVLVFTVYNVTHIVGLSRAQVALASAASDDEARAGELTARAAQIRRSIDQKDLQRVTDAAVEANGLIDARAFSWTELFNDLEMTLPPNVMLAAVSPTVTKGVVTVRMIVLGRDVDGIDAFIERLEQTGRFSDVLPRIEEPTEEGLYEATVEGQYQQASKAQPRPSAPAIPSAQPGTSSGGAASAREQR